MPARRQIAVLAAALAVAAAPGAAFAQNGAGDEQYQDPFAGSPAPKATPKPKPTPQQQTQTQTQTQTTPQPAATSATTTTTAAGALPRTGLDLKPLALIGVGLVAAGLLLRRRPRHGGD